MLRFVNNSYWCLTFVSHVNISSDGSDGEMYVSQLYCSLLSVFHIIDQSFKEGWIKLPNFPEVSQTLRQCFRYEVELDSASGIALQLWHISFSLTTAVPNKTQLVSLLWDLNNYCRVTQHYFYRYRTFQHQNGQGAKVTDSYCCIPGTYVS